MKKSFIFKKMVLVSLCSLPLANMVNAQTPLKDILQVALVTDPTLDEARANIGAAESQRKISEAGHHPIVSVSNTGVIAQKRTYSSERRSGPAINGKLNLYSWGAVEAEIERDQHKQDYFQHKFTETREQVGRQIGELYLTALRAKENIAIYKESLKRHDKLIRDLKVIVSYDGGRVSELNEALSRRNQTEAMLLQFERTMHNALSRLSRYTSKMLTEQDLMDPFAKVSAEQFIAQYHNSNIDTNPTFLAQQKEFESAKAGVEAAKARRKPTINLEGSASRLEREVYVNVSWDIYNPASKYQEQQSYYSQKAAEAKLQEIELEVSQQGRTAEIDMVRNQKLAQVANKQISLQKNVVKDTELQFEIAMKSLIDVLDAYQELTAVQATEVSARNDFRDAALLYLVSQSRVSAWAGVTSLSLK
ncbi:TolC family protein [Mannheimia granulomatis]|uniref:TolC family protein n=2 Tax=Mannheimia granulomatis TaxID=85402 RepID=UPI00047A1096|nr:TolC family protein [Mannheimia granulomatis]QLB19186.1 transporter [Mannheimia granulomatis]